MLPDVAIVAIGRNEGERLRLCLKSAVSQALTVIYVDSGSTDDSKVIAQELGAHVLDLDLSQPFTAARARNTGFRWIREHYPEITFVQFIDGDCELDQHWIGHAHRYLESNKNIVATFGRRRERYPMASIYNQLCDWEWDITPGEVKSFGGDVFIRSEAFQSRSGYAYALGASLHGGSSPERYWVRETLRPWVWVPVPLSTCIALIYLVGLAGLTILLVYPLQIIRVSIFRSTRSGWKNRITEATFNTLARFPELLGQFRFLRDRLLGNPQIIEYK